MHRCKRDPHCCRLAATACLGHTQTHAPATCTLRSRHCCLQQLTRHRHVATCITQPDTVGPAVQAASPRAQGRGCVLLRARHCCCRCAWKQAGQGQRSAPVGHAHKIGPEAAHIHAPARGDSQQQQQCRPRETWRLTDAPRLGTSHRHTAVRPTLSVSPRPAEPCKGSGVTHAHRHTRARKQQSDWATHGAPLLSVMGFMLPAIM